LDRRIAFPKAQEEHRIGSNRASERALDRVVQLLYKLRATSALGQKATCAPQKAMSALPPIATAKADLRDRLCPLYP
jgi:hypothetical protein